MSDSPQSNHTPTVEFLEIQIDRLARFIEDNFPTESNKSKGAIDTAIHLLSSQKPVTPQPQPSAYSDKDVAKAFSNGFIEGHHASSQGVLRDLIKLIDEERYQMQLDEVHAIQKKGATDSK